MAFALTLGLAVTVRHIGTSPALLVELSLALEAKLKTPTYINFPSVFFYLLLLLFWRWNPGLPVREAGILPTELRPWPL